MKSNKPLNFIDYVIIILEAVYFLSVLPSFTIDVILPLPHATNLAVLMVLFYIIRFKGAFLLLRNIGKYPLIIIYLIIVFFDTLQNLVMHFSTGIVVAVFFVNVFFFLEYLYSLSEECHKVRKPTVAVLAPYTLYSHYNVFVILFTAVLVVAGLLTVTAYPMPAIELIEDNVSLGQTYYFPGYLSVATQTNRIFEKDIVPMLTGLSHEPHVLALLILPSFFLSFTRQIKPIKKVLLYLTYLLVVVIGQSATAIAFFVVTIAIEFIWLFIVRKNYSSVIILALMALIIVFKAGSILDGITAMMMEKAGGDAISGEGSFGYTMQMLNYVISSTSLIGYGNYPTGAGFELVSCSPGYLTSFLDILFFLLFFVKSIMLLSHKEAYYHYVGLACFYFILHSLKVSFLVFHYPILTLMLFILVVTDQQKKEDFNKPKFRKKMLK